MLFFKIIKLLIRCKIIFKAPVKTDILVLDDVSLSKIKLLINNYDHFVLPIRYHLIDKVYISFEILINLIKNFLIIKMKIQY